MGNEKGKNILLALLIIGLVTMTVVFASLQTQLRIGNNDLGVSVTGGTWDVHFLTTGLSNSTTGEATFVGTPVVSQTSITGLSAKFQDTGDSVSYTFIIQNAGTVDAKISSITPSTPNPTCTCTVDSDLTSASTVCNNLSYSLAYSSAPSKISDSTAGSSNLTNGTAILANQVLKAGEQISATFTIAYNSEQIPTNDVVISNINRTILFVQN